MIKSNLQSTPPRLGYIDGIRGIASVLVVFCHLACVFYPFLYSLRENATFFERIFLLTPLNVITNGNSAVQCFFTLSGFLIARKFYLKKDSAITNPVNLYVKLLKIVFPAVTLATLLMLSGAMFHIKAAQIDSNLNFVNSFNNFTPTLKSFISDVFFRTYIKGSIYVGPLWTIRIEFVGTILISSIAYYASGKDNLSKVIYLFFCVIFLLFMPEFCSFILGAFAFDCTYKMDKDNSILGKIITVLFKNKVLRLLFFLIGMYLFCVGFTLEGFYKPLSYLPDILSGHTSGFRSIGIAILIVCVELTPAIKNILSAKPLRWLGSISAYIYAFHWPMILSAGCGVFIVLKNHFSYNIIFIFILLTVFILTFLLAWGYTKLNPLIHKVFSAVFDKIKLIDKIKS